MSEFMGSNPELNEIRLLPPLSRVAILTAPEKSSEAVLHFSDIPLGREYDVDFLISSQYFNYFAFMLWNASQPKDRALARLDDVENRTITLYSDGSDHAVSVADQARELVSRYELFANVDDPRAETRLAFINQAVHEYLEQV